MKVKELCPRIEQFLAALQEHADLWESSLGEDDTDSPVTNRARLRDQMGKLSRQLGMLRPYINTLGYPTIMTLGEAQWDIYDSAVSNGVSIRKGKSLEAVLSQLHQVLGRLDTLDPDDEIVDACPIQEKPQAAAQPITINLHGTQSRVNVQSADNSTNVSDHSGRPVDTGSQRKDMPKPEPRPPEPKTNIRFVGARCTDAYNSDDTVFHETQRGLGDFKLAIVCFRNEAIVGQRIPSVAVRAHVIYRDGDSQEITDIPSGVWLGEYKGHVDFTLGAKKGLIVFFLTNQRTLKKLWKEEYRHAQSWMNDGLPSYRVRDEPIHGQVATVEIQLLSESTDICVLGEVFEVGPYEDGALPTLTILPRRHNSGSNSF